MEAFFLLNKYHWIITKTVKISGHSHHFNPIQDEPFRQKGPPSLRYAPRILQG